MQNVIIIHGRPSKEVYYSDQFPTSANFGWLPWLKKQLMMQNIKTDIPEMPDAYEPNYKIWSKELERFDVTPETILIGHSAGAGFLLRWLSENSLAIVHKVILVAPSIDPHKKTVSEFYDFTIDKYLAQRCKVIVITSDNDSEAILNSVQKIQESIIGITTITFPGYGHFIPEHMGGSNKFPELLQECL